LLSFILFRLTLSTSIFRLFIFKKFTMSFHVLCVFWQLTERPCWFLFFFFWALGRSGSFLSVMPDGFSSLSDKYLIAINVNLCNLRHARGSPLLATQFRLSTQITPLSWYPVSIPLIPTEYFSNFVSLSLICPYQLASIW